MANNILLIINSTVDADKVITLVEKLGKWVPHLTIIYIYRNKWQGLLGGEWISSKKNREIFLNYMNMKQQQEVRQVFNEIETTAASIGLRVETLVKSGNLFNILSASANIAGLDLVIVPHSANNREVGNLAQKLSCPVLTGPF